MKKYFTIALLLLSISGFSQSIFRPAAVVVKDLCSEPDIIAHNMFINHFLSPNLRFVRSENTLTTNWTSAYCDCELCHSAESDTSDFSIPIGDSCLTSAHFYPAKTLGTGVMKIKIFDPKDRSNFVVGQYSASCTSASSLFLNKEELKVYPNPANTRLSILFGNGGDYQVSIIGVDGKLFLKEKVSQLANYIDISGLDAGLYSVKIESEGKVFFAKFVKS